MGIYLGGFRLQELYHPHQPRRRARRRAAPELRVAPHPEEVGRETRADHALRPGNVVEAK